MFIWSSYNLGTLPSKYKENAPIKLRAKPVFSRSHSVNVLRRSHFCHRPQLVKGNSPTALARYLGKLKSGLSAVRAPHPPNRCVGRRYVIFVPRLHIFEPANKEYISNIYVVAFFMPQGPSRVVHPFIGEAIPNLVGGNICSGLPLVYVGNKITKTNHSSKGHFRASSN